jgi:hypothetical protein
MNEQWLINSSYYCMRGEMRDLILVLNSHAYVLARYRERTGELSWQRVIPAGDRKSIEDWLGRHFPVAAAPSANAKTGLQ